MVLEVAIYDERTLSQDYFGPLGDIFIVNYGCAAGLSEICIEFICAFNFSL